jgi:hypothetical protein
MDVYSYGKHPVGTREARGALMPDPLTLAVATVLATKGVDAVLTGGKSAVGALMRTVRKRMSADARGTAVLQAAMDQPDSEARRLALAEALTTLVQQDRAFGQQLRLLWSRSTIELGDRDAVVNHFSGTAEKVVQARDIRGDVNF